MPSVMPIVALTAQAFADQVADCHASGMTSHLSKPFTPDALHAGVRDATRVGRPVLELV